MTDKKEILQFLPEFLLEQSKSKHIIFKDKKIKTSYIIDIIHNMLLKYYFKKDNRFTLSSLVLKDKYGYLYNYYIQYLLEIGAIKMIKNYLKGNNSRIYALEEGILKNKILRYRNTDKFLIKKLLNKHLQFELNKSNIINREIKEKLISDLYSVEIDFDRSISYLDSLKKDDIDVYNRNKYSVESINNKNIFYHFDSYGRLHTNFTILKGFIRKNCLMIDNEETCEIDINNSQPLFLYKLIIESESRWVNKEELEIFSILVKNGNYYQYLIDKLCLNDKSEAKEITYKVLFGRNRVNSKPDKLFSSIFPTIYNYIRLYKNENKDYKILAYDLQMAESKLIFNKIIKEIMNINLDIKVITVHDSIIVQKKWKDIVSNIFFNEIFKHFNKNTNLEKIYN